MPGQWWNGQPWCAQCQRAFPHQEAIRAHYQSSQSHHWCARCDRDFNSAVALRSHLANSPSHAFCTLCNTDFFWTTNLQEHFDQDHYKCSECSSVFLSDLGLHEHARQSHHYCVPCRRIFNSYQNLQAHLGSSVHAPSDFPCPSVQFGSSCQRLFVSQAAAIAHLEAGTCASGMTRFKLDQLVVQNDRHHLITNPNQRLLGWDDSQTSDTPATSGSYNHYLQRYECLLCSRSGNAKLFTTLHGLNQHLTSPKHAYSNQERLYRCPKQGCGGEFWTLSGLVQHVESSSCGARQFTQQVMGAMGGGMRSIAY